MHSQGRGVIHKLLNLFTEPLAAKLHWIGVDRVVEPPPDETRFDMRQHRLSSHSRLESLNANAAMLGHAVPRGAARVFVRLPAWVTVESHDTTEHVAFVRDISSRGIFFYSDWAPCRGQEVSFVLQYLSGNSKVRLHLTGMVVRVERGSGNSAVGTAVAFDGQRDDVPRSPIRVR
jgi:hypothetical protein